MKTRGTAVIAKVLQVDVQTVVRLFHRGELRGGKVGGQWRACDDSIIFYLRERNLLPIDSLEVTVDKLLESN